MPVAVYDGCGSVAFVYWLMLKKYLYFIEGSFPFMAVTVSELFGVLGCLVVVFAALCLCNERYSHRATGSVRKGLDILHHSFLLSSKLRYVLPW